MPQSAEDIVKTLNLAPHPEGGYYRQTWCAEAEKGVRPAGTAIYFLLAAGQKSHWHKVDSAEMWHYYAGAPLKL
ncbi:MAG: cupin domain-containing protein, partial [Pseudomonadota bacterium]